MDEVAGGDHAREIQRFAPATRAVRGGALREYAKAEWPDVYARDDAVDSAEQLVHDTVHAYLTDVPVNALPEAVGELLGTLAADVMVDRAVEARDWLEPPQLELMIAHLTQAICKRHYGDE